MERTRQQARDAGYVETVFGRRLYLDYIHSRNAAQRAGAERAAINAPMQGTAADIIKRAMVRVDAWLEDYRDRALMILQVHDELVFEADEGFLPTLLEQAPALMAGAAGLRVPLVVDSGVGTTGTKRTDLTLRRGERFVRASGKPLWNGFLRFWKIAMNHS
jgi:DNA polymerase-1